MLARRDRLAGDLGVGGWNGQIHDDLDVGISQHVLAGAPLRDVVLLGLGACALLIEVTQDHHPYVGKAGQVLQVGVADHPGTDEPTPTGPDAAIT
jgi:hypothetical protein